MKKTIYILIALTGMVFFSGCEDFLTDKPESVLTQVDFYNNMTRINQGVLGCYAGMTKVMNDEWMHTELRSDNTCVSSTGSSSNVRAYLTSFAHFSLIPSEPILLDYWYNTFQNISSINAILPSVMTNEYITLETQRAQLESELRFIRAYHYLQLVNLFGDMFKITTVIGPNEAKRLVRSPVEEIYNEIIIPDLLIASEGAPESYPSSDVGRVTKWAAKGLLAKSYMMKGGLENLALAKPLLEEVLAEGSLGLVDNFADLFDPSKEMNDQTRKEVLFAVRYKGGGLGIGSPFWEYFAPESSANKYLAVGSPDGNNNPTLEIRALFEKDSLDSRSDASYGVYERSATRIYPYVAKYIDENISQALQAENDWIILRYADIVLLYAEVLAQDGNFAIAHNQVNKVRERAGVQDMAAFTSEKMALDSVYQERRLELAFENHRWFDLLRMADSYNDENKPMDILIQHTFHTDSILYSSFNPLPVPVETNYVKERLLLPIPQSEIDTNNEIKIPQNDGY
ncbi:MAG: RagB/SusD family nutrient uptake outer membrane protein [Bacteroidales bacterium]|nr:RagB/SusD family nutrient uptake outer membrane protein [Bacteroidales bacterium]